MDILSSCIFTQPYDSKTSLEDDNCDYNKRDRNQKTPQYVIDSLPRYTVRPNGAYSQPECSCGICYCKYRTGDKIVCLPCQHNFHDYCIENWLKWVKATCPVDKKSIIRRQYIDELIKERQTRILNLFSDTEPQENRTLNERSFLICEGERTEMPDTITKENVKEKREQKNTEESSSQKDCSLKLLSLTERIKSDSKKNESKSTRTSPSKNISHEKRTISATDQHRYLELNGKNYDILNIFSTSSSKKLQESVRRNIKPRYFNVPKPECQQKFQETHKTAITKLSSSSICSTNEQGKQKKTCFCNPYTGNFRVISQSKNKELERDVSLRGIMGKQSLTFGDLLEIENEVTSGWIYKMDKPNVFDPKGLKKV